MFYDAEGRLKMIEPLVKCTELQIFDAAWRGDQFYVLDAACPCAAI